MMKRPIKYIVALVVVLIVGVIIWFLANNTKSDSKKNAETATMTYIQFTHEYTDLTYRNEVKNLHGINI